MKKNKTQFTQKIQTTQIQDRMQRSKYLLPKLKSYSQNDAVTYTNLNHKKQINSIYPFTHETKSGAQMGGDRHDLSKISLIKYQYINKSPNYFRRQQMHPNSVRLYDHAYQQPVETYVEQKMKQFNKKALMNLVNSRIKSITSSDKKFQTIQDPSLGQKTTNNSRLIQKKIKVLKYQGALSFERFTGLNNTGLKNIKPFMKGQTSIKIQTPKNKTINYQDHSIGINHEQEKDKKSFKTLQKKEVQFYETKYSNFEPNKIQNLKNHIKNIKKPSSFKLNLYNFE